MGLDMYLNARKYVGNWSHSTGAEKKQFVAVADAMEINPELVADGSPHLHGEVCVAYWRKANAIHKWFVDNCQDGKDECQKAYVEREKLEELLRLCKETVANRENILAGAGPLVLSPQSGFFFGSTEVDESYFGDMEETVTMLERILNSETLKDWQFEYQSSW